jgi:hypothetical protein
LTVVAPHAGHAAAMCSFRGGLTNLSMSFAQPTSAAVIFSSVFVSCGRHERLPSSRIRCAAPETNRGLGRGSSGSPTCHAMSAVSMSFTMSTASIQIGGIDRAACPLPVPCMPATIV